MEIKYETEKKERQLAEAKQLQNYLLFGAIGLVLILLSLFQYFRNKQKIKQKEAELAAQLEHAEAQKLREMDVLKSTFFANVSHEFRTPLTLIISPVEQMMNGTFKGDFQKYYRIIHRNGKRLLNLVNQLMDLSKLESGKLKLQASEGDLGRFVSALAGSFESLSIRQQVDFQITIPDAPLVCFFDRDKVEKIVTNLVSNASNLQINKSSNHSPIFIPKTHTMPLTQPLAELRKNIREILIEDLPAAIKALGELLPEGAEKHSIALSMLAQINDANKAHFRNTISPEEYARRIDTVRANFLDLLNGLEETDFEEPLVVGKGNTSSAKTGSVLYRVPHRMPLRKPVICTVRVAIDEDALLEDIVLDANVRIKQRVEVSDMMKAELLDPEGSVFQIRNLSEVTQLVRETGKTQWLFSVTPLLEGEHQLLVKVSMMEFVPNLGTYVPREVSILETVTIVTELAITDEEEAPMKSTGESFAMSHGPPRREWGRSEGERGGADAMEVETSKGASEPLSPPPPAPVAPPSVIMPERSIGNESATESYIPAPQPMIQPQEARQSRPISGRVRAVSFFLLFLIVGSTGAYALTPPPVRDFWFAELSGSAEAFADYIEEYKNDPAYQNDTAPRGKSLLPQSPENGSHRRPARLSAGLRRKRPIPRTNC